MTHRGRLLAAAALGAAAATPFVVAPIRVIRRGWLPLSDTAAITIRAWEVPTGHSPLVGQRTSLHGVYDLGPLEYWLLTVPVHLDPAHGSLWGAALFSVVAVFLTIAASWAAFGPLGGAAAGALALGCVAWVPSIALNPAWNPYLGMMWFLTSLAAACAVMCGRRWWWPVLVLAASIAAQCHLMFAITAGLLVLVALGVALVGRRRSKAGWGPFLAAVAVAVACWAAPIVQELTARRGNITLLLRQGGAKAGTALGLRMLSAAVMPPALWWRSLQGVGIHGVVSLVNSRTSLSGYLALGFVALPLLVAWGLRSRPLAALATATALASAGLVLTFADLERAQIDKLVWLVMAVFPVGALAWLSLCSALGLLAHRFVARARSKGERGLVRPGGSPRAHRRPFSLALLPLALVVFVALGFVALGQQAEALPSEFSWQAVPVVSAAAERIEHTIPPERVRLAMHEGLLSYIVVLGVAAQLEAAGYEPEVSGSLLVTAVGPGFAYTSRAPLASLSVGEVGGRLRALVSFRT